MGQFLRCVKTNIAIHNNKKTKTTLLSKKQIRQWDNCTEVYNTKIAIKTSGYLSKGERYIYIYQEEMNKSLNSFYIYTYQKSELFLHIYISKVWTLFTYLLKS